MSFLGKLEDSLWKLFYRSNPPMGADGRERKRQENPQKFLGQIAWLVEWQTRMILSWFVFIASLA